MEKGKDRTVSRDVCRLAEASDVGQHRFRIVIVNLRPSAMEGVRASQGGSKSVEVCSTIEGDLCLGVLSTPRV